MKRIALLIYSACLVLTVQGQGVGFKPYSMQQALEKAKTEGKIVFADFFAEWCGPCKHMDATVLADKQVGDYFNRHFIAIKLDIEKGEGPALYRHYALNGIPGYVFLDAQGVILHRCTGAMPAADFLAEARTANERGTDPDNVSRMAARYPAQKNDEKFLADYLGKLKKSGSTGHFEVFEQYLRTQRSIDPQSREMVMLLAGNADLLVYGGEADRIIRENIKSEPWRLYVRKDVREAFLKFPEKMLANTARHATAMNDPQMLKNAFRRAREDKYDLSPSQQQGMLVELYNATGRGEELKPLAFERIEEYYNSLDVEKLQEGERTVREIIAKEPNRKVVSNAVIYGDKLARLVKVYAGYASTPQEKANVMRWAQRVYDLVPTRFENVDFFADMHYLCGDRSEALRFKARAYRLAQGTENEAAARIQYEKMIHPK